jgi:putative addiction module component (TIGR02574 family)
MTVDQIVEAANQLPPEEVAELVDRLTLQLHPIDSPETENAWKQEVRLRVAELESGRVNPVPGEEVSESVRRIVGR